MKYVITLLAVLLSHSYAFIEAADSTCQRHHPCAAHECVRTPETKTIKKVVYDVKCVPVCEHRPAKFLDCDCCPVCELRYKRVLVKREIIVAEICTTKCVPVELPCSCCKE